LLLLLALMRPQHITSFSEASLQSRDIYLALDVSGSMRAPDLKPSRIQAAKETLKHFVDTLQGDRIGLVVFAGKAFTQCPLTTDHDVVKYFIDQVDIGTVGIDGTALGDGLLLAVQRLLGEPKAGQVIVLATDGRSNTGQPPMLAAQVAASAGIKLYTIGMGAKGGAILRERDPFGRIYESRMEEPDEALMTSMAEATGGLYFRATDSSSLKSIYSRISELEQHEVKVKNRREADERFFPYLWLGALLLAAEALLRLRLRMVM
jgi:Ca-activated chloride channel family protein